jgi:hypothetical protein
MICRACELRLDPEDNYCRKCGAAVRVIEMPAVAERSEVVRVGPSAPALIVSAARPIATGAAAVAAGALVKFAMRRAVRGLVGGAAKSVPASRSLARREEPVPAPRTVEVTEVIWYRKIVRG